MLSSVSKMLEKVGEGVAMAVGIAAGDLTLDELEEKVIGYQPSAGSKYEQNLLKPLELGPRILKGHRMVLGTHFFFSRRNVLPMR